MSSGSEGPALPTGAGIAGREPKAYLRAHRTGVTVTLGLLNGSVDEPEKVVNSLRSASGGDLF